MNHKDWEDGYREAIDRGRARVGEPPTPEEMMAYSRGDLPPHEKDRIRELLSYYPDLAEGLVEEADPSIRESHLSEHQLAQDWSTIQKRLKRSPAPVINARAWHWGNVAAVAACVVVGLLYVRSLRQISDLRQALRSPRIDVESISLYERGGRGSSGTEWYELRLLPTTEYVSLNLTLASETAANQFHVDIVDLETPTSRTVWTSRIYRGSDGVFTLHVPRTFFTSTRYAVRLYADGVPSPLVSYLMHVKQSTESPHPGGAFVFDATLPPR
jgi:hypothetical protein